MQRLIVIVAGAVVLVLAGLALADAAGFFGVVKRDYRDVVHVRFRAVDAATGRAIGPVYVNCFRRGQEKACSTRANEDSEVVDVNVGTVRVVERSRLLGVETAQYDLLGDDAVLHAVFIHPDYEQLARDFTVAELRAFGDVPHDVPMTPSGN